MISVHCLSPLKGSNQALRVWLRCLGSPSRALVGRCCFSGSFLSLCLALPLSPDPVCVRVLGLHLPLWILKGASEGLLRELEGGFSCSSQTALPCVSQTWRPEAPAEGECHPRGSWEKPTHTTCTLTGPLSQKGRSGWAFQVQPLPRNSCHPLEHLGEGRRKLLAEVS